MTTTLSDTASDTPSTEVMPQENGVAVIDGQGLSIKVVRGALEITDRPADGTGDKRVRQYRKAGRGGLRRIVVIGDSGMITLDAMQWCSYVGVPIVILRPDGELLSTTHYAPSIRPGSDGKVIDDARLRRAQALADTGTAGTLIRHQIVAGKVCGSADVVERFWNDTDLASFLRDVATDIQRAQTPEECRTMEGEAARRYFDAWTADGRVTVRFCENDRENVPAHWLRFGGRASRATVRRSARNATDPVNAILNYLYAIAASECRIAIIAMGLDPGLGFLHNDKPGRDSLVYDLLEVVRPSVERWALELLQTHVFRHDDFEETRIGSLWLRPPLSHTLANTAPLWARIVAPYAEQITHLIAKSSPCPIPCRTPLTSTFQRKARNRRAYVAVSENDIVSSMPDPRCGVCGNESCSVSHRRRAA